MENIIPRWEWRTFGESFGEAEDIIKTNSAKVRESSEIYILSEMSNDNTKVRDELMDIKYLVQVNDDKLEQWNPLLKASFPISVESLRQVIKSWKVEIPAGSVKEMTYEEFIEGLVKTHPNLRAVDVFKERHGYIINECIVEIANLKFNGKPIRTVAVEQEDPVKVMETVKMLKLDKFENINYLRALKNSVGLKY
jgi:hypothetical protein